MSKSDKENDAYLREVNEYFAQEKQYGDEIEFVSGNEIIKITKTKEFDDAVELIENTNKSVILTGKAGTGKSTLLKFLRSKSKKDIVVLAYTGLAAVNVGGETINSFFNFPIGFLDKRQITSNSVLSVLIRTVNTIVLDEVSMIRADMMDSINVSLQRNRGNNLPFGGVQMIFIGDLHQLPPIVEPELRPVYSQFYKTPYFFDAGIFDAYKILKIDLQKIHRQTDPLFVEILNNIREGNHVWASIQMLNRNVVGKDFLKDLQTSEYVVLCTTNAKTKQINDYYMGKVNSPVHEYEATVSGNYDPASNPTEQILRLKEGSKVMFVKNDSQMKTYVNGEVGIIKRLTPNSILVETKKSMISVERTKWEKYKYTTKYIDVTNEDGTVEKKRIITKELAGSFTQFPLKLAWAISIHKSQGQTYDKVVIDFDKGCFSSGQAYVALSRCRSYDGIKLIRPIRESDVILDRRIHQLQHIIESNVDIT